MAFHPLHKKCDDCSRVLIFRRPHVSLLVKILPHLPCHYCEPEKLKDVCASCRFPWTHVQHHSNGMCITCVVSLWRYQRSALQKVGRP
jgi:hypothetical protein